MNAAERWSAPVRRGCVMRAGSIWRILGGAALAAALLAPVEAPAVELWASEDGGRSCALDVTLRWTSLLSRASEDTVLYPERWSAASLSRMRWVLKANPAEWVRGEVAYEQRARAVSEGAGAAGGAGILISDIAAAYRLRQVEDALVEVGTTFAYRHELDRALIALHAGRAEIRVGRQAVGWGRGLFFGAVDFFSPFSPLEIDREWRRGVDAVRGTVPVTDLVSLDLVAAFGETSETSAFLARLHGYAGNLDGEIVVGRRAEDDVYAVTASFPLWDAEVHGEAALVQTPEPMADGGAFGRDDLVAVSVAGGSYNVDVGRGLYLVAEHHYSGFGVKRVGEASERLLAPVFLGRVLRGDTRILGRHAAVLQATYGAGEVRPLTLTWLFSPADGSGVLSPAVSWLFSDNLTLLAHGYIPYGRRTDAGALRSEYGGTPAGGLLQMTFYY